MNVELCDSVMSAPCCQSRFSSKNYSNQTNDSEQTQDAKQNDEIKQTSKAHPSVPTQTKEAIASREEEDQKLIEAILKTAKIPGQFLSIRTSSGAGNFHVSQTAIVAQQSIVMKSAAFLMSLPFMASEAAATQV